MAAPPPSVPSAGNPIYDTILDFEKQTWESGKDGGAALLPFLSSDCVMLLPGSTIFSHDSKPSIYDILSRQDMKPWTYYELRNVHVIPLGTEGAVISYAVNAERQETDYRALITSVWRNVGGQGWKMVTHQQTPLDLV